MFKKSSEEQNETVERSRGDSNILDLLKSKNALIIIALLVGILIGVFFGWQVWPVQWSDASIEHLRLDLQTEWVRFVAYGYSGGLLDEIGVTTRLDALGESSTSAFLNALADPQSDRTGEALAHIQNFYDVDLTGVDTTGGEDVADTPADEPADDTEGGGLGPVLKWGGIILGVLVISGGVVYFLSKRKEDTEDDDSSLSSYLTEQFGREGGEVEAGAVAPTSMGEPLNQWMTTYVKGDDLFDDSFSIDAPSGEFLGECGVGIADTIGVGDPKKVSAFEVWLFDKNDIQTVTKVLMSNHLFDDDHSRNRLAAKGEPLLAETGQELILGTATLQMSVRVVDIAYGQGALPDKSFFDRITLELTVWEK